MRKIKFRAWDKEEKKFREEGFYTLINGDGEIIDGEFYGDKELDNVIISQFTGLLDKNDKEIYEGDIITYGFKTEDFNDLILHTGKVFYKEYMFLVDGDTIHNEWHSINRIHYTEVIGNIYENKDLITKTKTNE